MGATSTCLTKPPLISEVAGCGRFQTSPYGPRRESSRGLSVWVDCIDDLVIALSLEADHGTSGRKGGGNLEHLYALPEGGGDAASGAERARAGDWQTARSPVEEVYYPRDVGVRSGCASASDQKGRFPWSGSEEGDRPSCNSFACVQVDDLANPWAFYAVGNSMSSALYPELRPRPATDIPGMLARNPRLHCSPSRALYETHMAATKAEACGDIYPETSAALSLALLREEFLHIAWAGDAKIVLGRLAAKAPVPAMMAPEPAVNSGTLRLASKHKPGSGRTPQEGYISSRDLKQRLHFDGPPPILRAVDLTAQSDSGGSGIAAADSAGGGGQGDQSSRTGSLDGRPSVRRMKLKPEDVCVIIATQTLWRYLTPEEVVTIVGEHLNCMASDAADALTSEVRRRSQPPPGKMPVEEELTIIVVYLAGERYVKDFEIERANHLEGDVFVSEGLLPPSARPTGLGLDQWGCCGRSGMALEVAGRPGPGL